MTWKIKGAAAVVDDRDMKSGDCIEAKKVIRRMICMQVRAGLMAR